MYSLSGINNSETLSQFSLQFLPLAFILKFHSSLSLLRGLLFRAQGSQGKHFYLLLVWFGSTFTFLSSSNFFCVLFSSDFGRKGGPPGRGDIYTLCETRSDVNPSLSGLDRWLILSL